MITFEVCKRCQHLLQHPRISPDGLYCNRCDEECPFELELLMMRQSNDFEN